MPSLKLSRRHLVGVASLTCSLAAASLTFASLPAGAQNGPVAAPAAAGCPVLSLGNPNPGDTINAGGYIISGTAYDPSATSGSGIARVELFLGQRDSGGTPLGIAIPGENGTDPRAFSIEVQVPSSVNRGTDFAAYAVGTTGQETEVSFPVFVGTPEKTFAATPTPVPTNETVTSTCPRTQPVAAVAPSGASGMLAPAAPAMAVGTPAAMSTGSMSTGATTAPLATACPVLSVGNPNPADNLTPGGYFISGTAYDPAATSGSGISRIDVFLGARDNGGTPLGSVVPGAAGSGDPRAFSLEVQIPGINRGTDFSAYATSAISGQQTSVTFPVYVGSPARIVDATPTPIPNTETVVSTCSNRG